jgi:hypothetical protein
MEQLQQIHEIILVAERVPEARAILQFLRNDTCHIRFCCAEEATALEVLKYGGVGRRFCAECDRRGEFIQ